MRKFFSVQFLLIACSAFFISTSGRGQILTFDFAGITGSEVSAGSNFNDPNLTSSTITRGPGLTASGNADRFNATAWTTNATIDADDYMQFTITPQSGYQFNVSSVYVQIQRSATGPGAIQLRSSVDNYASALGTAGTITDNTSTQNFTFNFLQSNSTTPVTYRVYMYAAEAAAGSGGIGDGTGNDIIVTGSVSSTSAIPTKLAITNINPSSPTVNSPFNVTVQAQDNTDGVANVAANTDVSLSVNTGTGTLGGTVSGTILAGTSTIVISGVTYNVAESGVVLTATRTSGDVLTAGNSSAFTVQPAPIEGLQVTSANTRFTIDFDNTVAGSNVGQFAGTTTSANPATGELNSKTWSIDGTSATNPAAFAAAGSGGGAITNLHPSGGTFYAFETQTGNVALGVQPTGSYFNPGNITLKLQNKTGSAITSLLVAYKLWVYNDQGRSNSFNFSYSGDNVSYTDIADLDFISTLSADGVPEWKAYIRSAGISAINVAVDGYFYIRWAGADVAGGGSRDEFAIDDISIVANSTSVYPGFSGIIQNAIIGGNTAISSIADLIDSAKVLPGATLMTNNNLTLKSTASRTARIGNSNGNILGNVTVERYIPANGRRAWRLLSAPLSSAGAPAIYNSWQESGAPSSAGTHITQAGGAGTNGFDASAVAGASSIRYWNGTGLVTPANTNMIKVTDNGGAYFLFVRGNRMIDLNNAAESSNTILRMTGAVNQGNLAAGVAGASFSLIPNPYPSPVDYEAIFAANPFSTFYVWDAAGIGSTGGYRTIVRTGPNTYTSTPGTGNATTDNEMRYIRSGQAFFIPVNSHVTFTESMKTDMVPTTNVYRPGTGTEEMTIDLRVMNGSANGILYDGVKAQYNNSYSTSVDANDAPKLSNFNENLAIVRDNKNLAIEQRPLVDVADTIFLKLWNTGIKDYRFVINPSNFSATANLDAFLLDGYLNTSTSLSLSAGTMFDFSVTSAAASAADNRFMIVFRPSAPLPVRFTNVKAFTKEAGIQVEWNVAAEVDVVKYEVEKSTNGTSFDKSGGVTANGSKSYNWFDATPNNGSNYYRIKVVNKDNTYSYSNVVNVKIGSTKGDIAVYPNPVKRSVINVQFSNLEKGTYNVQLINSIGQQVHSNRIVHQGGSASEALQLGSALSRGVYQLVITNGSYKMTQQVIAE